MSLPRAERAESARDPGPTAVESGLRYSAVVTRYREIRSANPGVLVLFRIGNFYEAWFEEAELLARELGLKLSSRPSGGSAPPVPQVGFAIHALDSYLTRLLQRGYRVAVVEEGEAAATGGPRARVVARTLTPGTVTDDALLPEDRANYLAALAGDRDRVGVAWTDVSTGEFAAGEYDADGALDELARLAPAEVLVGPHEGWPVALVRGLVDYVQTPIGSSLADPTASHAAFAARFPDDDPLADLPVARHAAGIVLRYLRALQGDAARVAGGLDAPTPAGDDALRIDPATRRHLELTETIRERAYEGSVLWAIDRTASAMGRRMLRTWLTRPLRETRKIHARQRLTQALLVAPEQRAAIRAAVAALPDLERRAGAFICGRVGVEALREIPEIVDRLAELQAALDGSPSPFLRSVAQVPADLAGAAAGARAALGVAGADRPVRAGFDPTYDALVAEEAAAATALERLADELRARSGISRLKVEQNAAQGWYVEVPANSRVPQDWLRKGGLARAERYACAPLEEAAGTLMARREARAAREVALIDEVVGRLRPTGPALRELARKLAAADALQSLATIAEERAWIRPSVDDSRVLDIREGRHPVLERILGERLVPNDVRLVADGPGDQVMVLTGPNMAGKSSLQRQVAILTILAQAGSYIPARAATIGRVDGIYTRLGSADDLARGQSTFFVEMLETSQILRHATDRSLCLFDELGRGTSTFDGLSIACAVLEHLATGPVRPRTILATHYHELAEIAAQLPQVGAYRMAVQEDATGVTFRYRVEPGGTDRSYGLAVARMAGLPESVLARAEAVARALEPATREGQRALRQALRGLPSRRDREARRPVAGAGAT